MAEGKAGTKSTRKTASKGTFTAEERAAMKDAARERKAGAGNDEAAVLEAIDALAEPDRDKARRLHALVAEVAPDLKAKTWYGMPAYARDGKVVCHFQAAAKFKTRYPTLGFSDQAKLDDGALWPVAFALDAWTPEVERTIRELLRRAVG